MLRSSAGPERSERYLTIGENMGAKRIEVEMDFPAVPPISGTSTFNPEQARAVSEASRTPMHNWGSGGRLMIFIRNMQEFQKEEELLTPIDTDNFSVFNSSGTSLLDDDLDWSRSEQEGCCAWSADGGMDNHGNYGPTAERTAN